MNSEILRGDDVNILVVEDDPSVARFLKRGLEEEGYTVDLVEDGQTALEQGLSHTYDGVLLDWMLPKLDGLNVLRKWREAGMRKPVIMLTARDGIDTTVLGLDNGADDYISKPFSFEVLLARLRANLRRSTPQKDMLAFDGIQVDMVNRKVINDGVETQLSNREFQLLSFLVQNRGKVLGRTKILDRVWGLDHDPATNVVDVYIRYLREKIDQPHAPSQIETIRGRGYRLRGI